MQINYLFDNTIRASVINDTGAIQMGDSLHTYTPIDNGEYISGHTIVSQDTGIQRLTFQDLLSSVASSDLQLSFGLISFLRSFQ